MRWKPKTPPAHRVVERFAWLPVTDPVSGTTVWLERVQLTQERQSPCYANEYWSTTEVNVLHHPSRLWAILQKQQQKYSLLLLAAAWWWFWSLADMLISRRMPAGYLETNPYTRDALGNFLFWHGAAHDAAYCLVYLAFGLLFVKGLGSKHRSWSQLPGALLLAWYGLEHFEGFLNNVWVHLGWYVPDSFIYR